MLIRPIQASLRDGVSETGDIHRADPVVGDGCSVVTGASGGW
jgi:hypothetical protein